MNKDERRKIEWNGTIVSIQPRTTVWRYVLDNRTHFHFGYNLFLDGEADGNKGRFSVALSEKQQQTSGFRIGDVVKGTAWTKMYAVSDYADYYRAGGLKIIARAEPVNPTSPPPYRTDTDSFKSILSMARMPMPVITVSGCAVVV